MRPIDSAHRVTLVAMPPSGEVFIARDNDDVPWLIPPPGAGQPARISDEVVERAIVDHGFDRVDVSFASWDLLDAERQRRAGVGLTPIPVDVARFDADDVNRLLSALDRARRGGQIVRARRFAHRLLKAPVVLRDLELHDRVVSFLLELDDIPPSAPPSVSDEPDTERLAAHKRVHVLQAA